MLSAKEEMNRARAAYRDAFGVAEDLGMLHPDGRMGMLQTSREYSNAVKRYHKASMRYREALVAWFRNTLDGA